MRLVTAFIDEMLRAGSHSAHVIRVFYEGIKVLPVMAGVWDLLTPLTSLLCTTIVYTKMHE